MADGCVVEWSVPGACKSACAAQAVHCNPSTLLVSCTFRLGISSELSELPRRGPALHVGWYCIMTITDSVLPLPRLYVGCKCGYCGAPALIAFTGKRQFLELCNIDPAGQLRRGKSKVLSSAVQLGKQPPDVLPPGWALPTDRTEVWVLTSTSGAAPMSNADRERPYQQLAERLAQVPWPRDDIPCQ